MSWTKWTLVAAGAVMGLRFMSDRHRRRRAGSESSPDDRSQSRSAPWPTPAQDRTTAAGLAGSTLGAGSAQSWHSSSVDPELGLAPGSTGSTP